MWASPWKTGFLITAAAWAPVSAADVLVAVRTMSVTGPRMELGKGMRDMLVTDLVAEGNRRSAPCRLVVVTWEGDRAARDAEIKLQQGESVDPRSRVATDQTRWPEHFVEGTVATGGGKVGWSLQVREAATGRVLASDSATIAEDKLLDAPGGIARRIAEALCGRPIQGWEISGRIDEATVRGRVCGQFGAPFSARSPEVAGNWTFTPQGPTSGDFKYSAASVGGAKGAGAGTYSVVINPDGKSGRIQLKGMGSITSPVGTFTAPINESLGLAPLKTCSAG